MNYKKILAGMLLLFGLNTQAYSNTVDGENTLVEIAFDFTAGAISIADNLASLEKLSKGDGLLRLTAEDANLVKSITAPLRDNLTKITSESDKIINALAEQIEFYKDNPELFKYLSEAKDAEEFRKVNIYLPQMGKIQAIELLGAAGDILDLYALKQSVDNVVNIVEEGKKATFYDYADVITNTLTFMAPPFGAIGAGLYSIEKDIDTIIDLNRGINDEYRDVIWSIRDQYFRQYNTMSQRGVLGKSKDNYVELFKKQREGLRNQLVFLKQEVEDAIILFGKTETLELLADISLMISVDKEDEIVVKQENLYNKGYEIYLERQVLLEKQKYLQSLTFMKGELNTVELSTFEDVSSDTPAKLIVTLPDNATLDNYQITAAQGETVFLNPFLTANSLLSCMSSVSSKEVEWKIWYYDVTQGSDAPRESMNVTLDKVNQTFSLVMPSTTIQIVDLTYNILNEPENNYAYGSCGLPSVWESRNINGENDPVGPSVFVRSGSIVTDTTLGLHWTDNNISSVDTTLSDAVEYCDALDDDEHDWRLPTREEMLTTVATSDGNLTTTPFQYVQSGAYWSSEKGRVEKSSYRYCGSYIISVCIGWVTVETSINYQHSVDFQTGLSEEVQESKVIKYSNNPSNPTYTKYKENFRCVSEADMISRVTLADENYKDNSTATSAFTKEWVFSQDINSSNLNIRVVDNTYQNEVTEADFTREGRSLKVNLIPDTGKPVNELTLQFEDQFGNTVKVSGSETFWSLTRTNHAPRLADGQITQIVSSDSETAYADIATYDADGDTVTLSVEANAGGSVSFASNRLSASFSDGEVAHTIIIRLNDGKESALKELTILHFNGTAVDEFYSDVDRNADDYIYDGIEFGTIQGVVSGQPDPLDPTKRIFRPTDAISMAEALAIIIKSESKAGLIELKSSGTYNKAFPEWSMPYYTYARDVKAIDREVSNLSVIYPTRETIAKIIVKTLDLEEKSEYLDTNVTFDDEAEFTDSEMLKYAKVARGFGLFMLGDLPKPQETINRAELSMVIGRIFMIPTATVSLTPESIEYKDTLTASLVNVNAMKVYNATGEVSVTYMSDIEEVSNPIDSSLFPSDTEVIYAVVDNNGVKNVLRAPLTMTVTDQDGDGTQDRDDAWPEDGRYIYDSNNNDIPDNLDTLFSISAQSSGDSVVIDGQIILIEELVRDGGYVLDFDDDGFTDINDPDDDNDNVPDIDDAFPFNPTETEDTDGDTIGNNADTDDDNDGISDTVEVENGLDPLNGDDANEDSDNDGVSNKDEIDSGTNPQENEAVITVKEIENIYIPVDGTVPSINIEANATNGSSLEYAVTSSNPNAATVSIVDGNLEITPVEGGNGKTEITLEVILGDKVETVSFILNIQNTVVATEIGTSGEYSVLSETSYASNEDESTVEVEVGENGFLDYMITRNSIVSRVFASISGTDTKIDHRHTATIVFPTERDINMTVTVEGEITARIENARLPKSALPLGTQVDIDAVRARFTVPMPKRLEF